MPLAIGHRHRPDRPELKGPLAEGPAAAGHLELRALGRQPAEELLEPGGRVVVAHRPGRPTGGAPPSPPAGGRPPVPLHGQSAAEAVDGFHGGTFSETL